METGKWKIETGNWKMENRRCHPERSEGSLQLFVNRWTIGNCGDPSLRSG
jgi:hypothetical protein